MKLHDLHNTVKRQTRKRVGRGNGSGMGTTAARGGKGANARTGFTWRPHFEGGQIPLFRRVPKRGFNNPNHIEYTVVNVAALEAEFSVGEEVSEESLRQKGLIGDAITALKVLGDGAITKALKVKANRFSASAKQKIEAAGGTCEVI